MEQSNTMTGPTPQAAKLKDVHVTVTGTGWNPIAWSQEIKTSGHGNNNDKIEFPHGPDNYDIIFTLKNDTGYDIGFNASGPIFVERALPGSPYPSSFNTDQMMVRSCDESKLVVRNWNEVKLDFNYQLNFVTNAGDEVRPFDPIIQNDGGGTKPTLGIMNR
jgi:hypothetical protein